jgi:hypothetical protein
MRNAYTNLVGKLEGERPLGKPRRRWENNIRTDVMDLGYEAVDSIHLAQDRDRW